MKIVDSVFELSNEFMKNPSYVQLNLIGIKDTAKKMLKSGQKKFKEPTTISRDSYEDIYKSVMMQLAGGAINYCYWYGGYNIRPNNCCASEMFKAVEDASEFLTTENNKEFCDRLKINLAIGRFPLLEERCKHIDEIAENGQFFCRLVMELPSLEHLMETMIKTFPGYASDLFLKRASLFFMMLYRFLGWFNEEVNCLHIPADYQVPKMLEDLNCLSYSQDLIDVISNNILIPKYSQAECEIRAATILACKKLGELTGWNAAEVDGWLWLQRDRCKNPFHLTVTTDY